MTEVEALQEASLRLADAFKVCGKAWREMYRSYCECDAAMYDYSVRCGITPGKYSRWQRVR